MSVLHIDQTNFEELVLKSEKPVLVDFWAPWCGPCRMVAPVLDQIAQEHDSIVVVKINVDENMELASRYNVTSIPTLMVVEDGHVKTTALGFRPKPAIEAMLGL